MLAEKLNILEKLDKKDQEKINYFINLILKKEKYKQLNLELSKRRAEIEANNIYSHDDIWKELNV